MALVRRSTDLPLERDAASRLLPWIIAVMVYLAALAIAGAMALNGALAGWSTGLKGTLTVQIPAVPGKPAATRKRVERAVAVLQRTAGVRFVRVVDPKKVRALVAPWMGRGAELADLPLPRLIDVRTERDVEIDLAALRKRLTLVVPDATVEDHQKWLGRLIELGETIWILALAIVGLIVFAAIATVVFATRTGLGIHARVIEVLNQVGARDTYIARQFERQALWLGLKGGVMGVVLAAVTLFGIAQIASGLGSLTIPRTVLTPGEWAIIAALPVVTAVVAQVTARVTVLRTLSKLA